MPIIMNSLSDIYWDRLGTTLTTKNPGDDVNLYGELTVDDNDVSTQGVDVYELYSETNFPPPVGGICTLMSGKYMMKNSFSLSAIDEFQCDENAVIEWVGEDKENHTLTHIADNKILFNFTDGSRFKVEHMSFILTGNNCKFISLTGANFSSKVNDFRVTFTGTGTTIADTLNTATGTNEFVDGTIVGFQNGITIDRSEGIQILGLLLASDGTGTDAIINIKNVTAIALNLNGNVFIGGPSQSNYYIDPVIKVPVQIFDSNTAGDTTFFKSGLTGTFTAVSDSSIGATTITSVTDSSGLARFNYTGPTVYECQEVVISGFTINTEYNGTYCVLNTGAGWFEILGISFGSNESGSFLSNSVTLTDISTVLTNGDSILINTTLSTDYDGGSFVYNKQVNSFQVNKTWIATETGTWDTGSLTQDNKYIKAGNNGDQAPSQNVLSMFVTNNIATITTTGGGTWDPLNVSSFEEGQSISRFKMLDTSDGTIKYIGLTKFKGTLIVGISAIKSGGTIVEHTFRAFKTVGSGVFDIITVARGLTTALASITLVTSIELNPGDNFRIEIASQGVSTVVTIQDMSLVVS